MNPEKMFSIPNSRLVAVKFNRGGVKHSAIIPRPRNYMALLCAMLPKKVGASMILGVNEVREIKRG